MNYEKLISESVSQLEVLRKKQRLVRNEKRIQFLKNVVELTPYGEIVIDQKGRTSVKGIYAAGDVTTTPYKQIVIAMGEGAKAGLAAFEDTMLHSAPVA